MLVVIFGLAALVVIRFFTVDFEVELGYSGLLKSGAADFIKNGVRQQLRRGSPNVRVDLQ